MELLPSSSISAIRAAYGIDPNDYIHLEAVHMPSRAALRAAGWTARFPLFYRGRSTDGVLADFYVHAHAFGFHDVLETRTMHKDTPTLLGRLGLSSSLSPLLSRLDTADRFVLLHTLLDAYAILGLTAETGRDVMLAADTLPLIGRICTRNEVAHLGELTPRQLAYALPLVLKLRNNETNNPAALGTTDWRKIAMWADFESMMSTRYDSDVYRLCTLYDIDEIIATMQQTTRFEPSMLTLMVFLRERVSRAMPVSEVSSYLQVPLPLFKDFFPAFSG